MTMPAIVLTGLFLIMVSCSQIKALPAIPAHHPESLAAGQQVQCSECHEEQQGGTMKPAGTFNHSPAFVKNHRFYAASDDRLCATCHKSSFCNDCHTNQVEVKPSLKYGYRTDLEMPHRGNFMTLHKIEGKLNPGTCYRCHGRSNNERCIACHR